MPSHTSQKINGPLPLVSFRSNHLPSMKPPPGATTPSYPWTQLSSSLKAHSPFSSTCSQMQKHTRAQPVNPPYGEVIDSVKPNNGFAASLPP